MRLNILANIIFFFLGLIVLGLFYMQIIRGDYYRGLSVNNHIRIVPVDAPRGRILDRNSVVLADNRESFNIAVIPQDIEDADVLFNFLSRVVNKDPAALRKIYQRRKLTPFEPVVIAEDIDRRALITVEENRFQYPGLITEKIFERFYPFRESGSHAVGYVGKIDPMQAEVLQEYGYTPWSLVGKTGAEQFYDQTIQGIDGGRQIEVNSRGQEVRLLGIKEPLKGKDIGLTVDQRVQSKAAELLGNQPGSVIVMDLHSGEVLGLASSPAFDPNAFSNRSENSRIENYMRDSLSPLLNRAISGQSPPGSVFKIPVALAAVERNKISTQTTFNCPGYLDLGGRRFGCAHVHGAENIFQAIAHSCNVYFFRAGQMLTAPVIGAFAKAMGLAHPTGIDLPSEASGKLVLPKDRKDVWYPGNTLNLSIGQGDTLATPIQLTVLMAAVANNGIRPRPRILKSINGKELPPQDLSKRPTVRLKPHTWDVVQKGLRQTVENPEGTAHLLHNLKGMTIWGKTGTAQAGPKGDHAWFAGYLHSAKSHLAFCVFLEHGGASSNAVALTHDLLQFMQANGII